MEDRGAQWATVHGVAKNETQLNKYFAVVQWLSHVWLFAPPWTAARQDSLSFTISWSLRKLMSIESVIPSYHFILCCSLLQPSIFPSIRVFSSESVLRIRRPKYWSFSFNISLSNEYSGLIYFKIYWFDSSSSARDSQRSSPASQFKSISYSELSLLYGPTLTSVYNYWKSHRFDYRGLCWQSDVTAF